MAPLDSETVRIGTNAASPTNKDGILDCQEQIQLTEIEGQWSSEAESRSSTGRQSLSVGFARDSPGPGPGPEPGPGPGPGPVPVTLP